MSSKPVSNGICAELRRNSSINASGRQLSASRAVSGPQISRGLSGQTRIITTTKSPSITTEWDDRARDELQKLAKSEINEIANVKTIIKTGKPFVEIIETAKEENIDLIIIATHGHSGVEHILFGSTAEKVVRKAPCPVLTLREPIKGYDYKEGIRKN